MNLVPSVKPGARELSESEMTERFFFSQSGFFPPNPIIFPGFWVSQEILEGIGGLGLGDEKRPSLEHMSWSNVTANILYGTWSCCNSGGLAFW